LINRLLFQALSRWEESGLGVQVLGRHVLRMDREAEDLTGWMMRFDLLEEPLEGCLAIALTLIPGINEEVQDPVMAWVLRPILIRQSDKSDHLLSSIKGKGDPVPSHGANVGFG
jgi:hypothetical protein